MKNNRLLKNIVKVEQTELTTSLDMNIERNKGLNN